MANAPGTETATETTAPLLALQIELERQYNKNQLMTRLRAEYGHPAVVQSLKDAGIPVKFGIDMMCQMCLHKRADMSTLVGTLRHHESNDQAVVELLKKACQADLIDWSPVSEKFIIVLDITEDVQRELEMFQYPLPMVVAPRVVNHNKQSGYMTASSSVILKDNHTDEDVCLDHINRMNAVRFTINFDTAKMVRNRWRNLDKVKQGETRDDLEKRKRAFEKYDRTAKEIMEIVTEHSDVIHLTHRYDKRGRTYAQGYHCNYQGNAWNKAVVEFADQEITN